MVAMFSVPNRMITDSRRSWTGESSGGEHSLGISATRRARLRLARGADGAAAQRMFKPLARTKPLCPNDLRADFDGALTKNSMSEEPLGTIALASVAREA